jgi:hypothetical protein
LQRRDAPVVRERPHVFGGLGPWVRAGAVIESPAARSMWVPENPFGRVLRRFGSSFPGVWWGSGRVEVDVDVMGWPLSGRFRLLGGIG